MFSLIPLRICKIFIYITIISKSFILTLESLAFLTVSIKCN